MFLVRTNYIKANLLITNVIGGTTYVYQVKDVIERAKGGVLFIDEAYSITENDHTDSYGRECLTELTKALEDYREDLVVIVAGYTEPMEKFFESNPGLKSRFNTFIIFNDYDVEELMDILNSICVSNDYTMSPKAIEKVKCYLLKETKSKQKNFACGISCKAYPNRHATVDLLKLD